MSTAGFASSYTSLPRDFAATVLEDMRRADEAAEAAAEAKRRAKLEGNQPRQEEQR